MRQEGNQSSQTQNPEGYIRTCWISLIVDMIQDQGISTLLLIFAASFSLP